MIVKGWSYSAYSTYNTCARKYLYAYIEKLPQPKHPAAERGVTTHKKGEDFLLGKIAECPPEFHKFKALMLDLRELEAQPELEIILDSGWSPAPKEQRWLKGVIDAAVIYEDNTGCIVDFKTGKQYPEHETQIQLYALMLRALHPEIGDIETRLWYLDQGHESKDISIAANDSHLRSIWSSRANKMLTDENFALNPGRHCYWCPFHVRKGGPCDG